MSSNSQPISIPYVLDLAGQEVTVGDRIAYATSQGNTAQLSLATVLEFMGKQETVNRRHYDPVTNTYNNVPETQVTIKLRIQSEDAYTTRPSLIQNRLKRFVKIAPKPVEDSDGE